MVGVGGSDMVSLGQLGSLALNDTTAVTAAANTNNKKGWGIIEATVDATFTLLTPANTQNTEPKLRVPMTAFIPNLAAFVLPKGQRIYGHFTAVTLATGKVIMYEV